MKVELPGVILIGTAHVSQASVDEVRAAIAQHKPDVVAVELDENRFKALTDKKRFEETPITDMLRKGKAPFILAHAMLASMQRRIGKEQGVEPGAEMLAAIQEAEATGARLVLADRDIAVTLRRAWRKMGAGEKWKLAWEFMKALTGADTEEELDVDEMLQDDVLTAMMAEFAQIAPTVAGVLISERDAYLAKNIQAARAEGKTVLAVLGAGHLKGVQGYLERPESLPDTKEYETVPEPGFRWGFYLSILISLGITAWIGWVIFRGFATGDWVSVRDNLGAYVIATAGMTALGVIVARGHILAVLAGAIAAPLKPLHFFLGSGIFPGLVQARVHKPTVADFEGVSRIENLKDLFKNKVTHILMVTSISQLGADLGLYLVFPLLLGYVKTHGHLPFLG